MSQIRRWYHHHKIIHDFHRIGQHLPAVSIAKTTATSLVHIRDNYNYLFS